MSVSCLRDPSLSDHLSYIDSTSINIQLNCEIISKMHRVINPTINRRKAQIRAKFSREVRRIVRENHEEVDELVNTIHTRSFNISAELLIRTAPDGLPIVTTTSSTDKLRYWAINHNVTRRSVNELLKILKDIGLGWLPKDSRTMCRTPRSTIITEIAGGKYWYNGIENNLRSICSNIKFETTLKLNFNVDGIPLMKSSATQFWPILANINSR